MPDLPGIDPPLSSRSAGRRPSVTICGSANGAHALAVVASQNADADIDWLAGSEERAPLLRRGLSGNGLRSTGAVAARADRIRRICADPAEVIPGADVVLILVPAFGHGRVLRRIAPYLSEGTALGCMPARGALSSKGRVSSAAGLASIPRSLACRPCHGPHGSPGPESQFTSES